MRVFYNTPRERRGPVWSAKARTCAPRGRGVGRWAPTSGRGVFVAQPRLNMTTQTPAASLLDRAEARWHEVGADQPELVPAIALQRRLVTRTIHTVGRLNHTAPILSLTPDQAAERVRAGTPALRGAPVALPVALLGPLVLEACDDLATGDSGDTARRVRTCLDEGRIDMGSLLMASFDRNQNAILAKAVHDGVAPNVLWLAAELAVGPAAYVAQRTLFGPTDAGTHPALTDAVAQWPHGYCPACGSWPAFGECPTRQRLRCSFCGVAWQPNGTGCTYCEGAPVRPTPLRTEAHSAHRAELCSGCGAYLKWLDLGEEPTPFELLAVEDLASTPLDRLAVQQGFGRPSLPELGGPERYPCQMEDPTR